jgi:predicted nucleotide-binding protein
MTVKELSETQDIPLDVVKTIGVDLGDRGLVRTRGLPQNETFRLHITSQGKAVVESASLDVDPAEFVAPPGVTQIEHDAHLVLGALAEYGVTDDDAERGYHELDEIDLQGLTNLPTRRLNDAIDRLDRCGYLSGDRFMIGHVLNWLGTLNDQGRDAYQLLELQGVSPGNCGDSSGVSRPDNRLAAALAKLSGLIAHPSDSVTETHVDEYHATLRELQQLGHDVKGFWIPESALRRVSRSKNHTTGERKYSSKRYVDRSFYLATLSAAVEHFSRVPLARAQTPSDESSKTSGKARPTIFVGHGQDPQWEALELFLRRQRHYDVESFESGPRAGYPTTSVLENMLDKASMALLVHTAEDETADGSLRARENVVHEAGLFQGRLGFTKAIVLLEDGCNEYSNIQGLTQIRFPKGNIRQVFLEVLQTIQREFPPPG